MPASNTRPDPPLTGGSARIEARDTHGRPIGDDREAHQTRGPDTVGAGIPGGVCFALAMLPVASRVA